MRKEKLGSVRLKEKGQITIPAQVRKALQLESGDRLDLYVNEKQELVLVKSGQLKQIRDLVSKGINSI